MNNQDFSEVCFLILHPDDPAAILLSTTIVRCLKKQVEHSTVISLLPESCTWLLKQNPYADILFAWHDNPAPLLPALRDLAPDYLIDLNGNRSFRKFKNRLKVLDFTLNSNQAGWLAKTFEKLAVFDVSDDLAGPEIFPDPPDPAWLPSTFSKGYLVISLDDDAGNRPFSWEMLVSLATMIEKPLVLTGEQKHRPLANLIARQVGCTVYPACGDFSVGQTASIFSGSSGVLAFDRFGIVMAKALKKPLISIDGDAPDLGRIAERMRKWLIHKI